MCKWAAANCAAPPSIIVIAIASQYATSNNGNQCWSCPCKWRHIHVENFKLFFTNNVVKVKSKK